MSGAILIGASRLTDCGHRAKGAAQHTEGSLSHTQKQHYIVNCALMLCCVLVLSERQIMKKHFHLNARNREFLSAAGEALKVNCLEMRCTISRVSIPITSAVTFFNLPSSKIKTHIFCYAWSHGGSLKNYFRCG